MKRKKSGTEKPTNGGAVRYPLHVTLAAVFVAVLVLFGVALIAYATVQGRRAALIGADDLLDRIGRQLRADIARLYQPAQGLVDITSRSAIWAAPSLDERLKSLPAVAEALRLNPTISAFFVGADDGDFFLARPLGGRAASSLAAPPGAVLAVQSVEREGDGGLTDNAVLFFDADLALIERRHADGRPFDPRDREWYRAGIATDDQVATDFYVFFTTGEVGLTFARRLVDGSAVVGADITLEALQTGLAELLVTPSTRIAVTELSGQVIALSSPELAAPAVGDEPTEPVTMPRLAELGDPALVALGRRLDAGVEPGRFELEVDGERWLGSTTTLPTRSGAPVLASTLIPRRELLAEVDRVRNRSLAISAVLLLLAVGIAVWVSRNVSRSLRALAAEAADVRRFKLGRQSTVRSRITEVDELAETMGVMKASLAKFFDISRALAAEKEQGRLLEMILREACTVAHADGGAILLVSDDETELEVAILEIAPAGVHVGGTSGVEPPQQPVTIRSAPDVAGRSSLDRETADRKLTVVIDDVDADLRFDLRRISERFDSGELRCRSVASVPLVDQKGELVGLMQLVNARDAAGEAGPFDQEVVPFVEALSADAAVALDLRRLLKAQKDLLEAFIHVVAGAIDAKSPTTHGHCQRVPVIAKMLAERAHAASRPPFDGFRLTEDEWYELHIASWLHDCGKVTTPEFVVDKSTKLETLSNRIHEVRTRFEVLWRDAELEYQRARRGDGAGEPGARRRLTERLDQLRDDWAFVADCNLGETPMDEARLARLRAIASQTWQRHFDDRLGLSHEELARKQRQAAPELPATEQLLSDRPEHLIERPGDGHPFGDNLHGFKMEVPEHLYNLGEVYNLEIPRGTLTAEERFKINDHIIQTINMLGRMPFPRELRRVPAWAGNHHEKLDGTGYPRRLTGDVLSVPERIMAIADVFEALTATDRPYMRPKTLSTALAIMARMRDGGHLCPDLFELFLSSGLWREYGQRYLQPEQMDEVDIEQLKRAARSEL